jgi:hypothetical protein
MFKFHRRDRRQRRRFTWCFEPLEARQLLSTVAAVTTGILPVSGVGPTTGIVLHESRGVLFTASLGTFITLAPGTGLQANINWGDGSSSKGVIKPVSPVGIDQIQFEVDGTHTYTQVGTFPIHVVVYKPGPTPTSPVQLITMLNDTAIVTNGNINLTGKIAGHYTAAPTAADLGALYLFTGTGAVADMGPVAAKGSLNLPGFISVGHAMGTLTLTTISATTGSTSPVAGGSVTLKLTGPAEAGFGPIPSMLTYTVIGGTGRFAGASGSGTIAVTLGTGNAFTFDIKSILATV